MSELLTNTIIIDANLDKAYETIPESFIPITNGLYINGKINGKEICFLADTGANISVMSYSLAKELGVDYLIDHHYEGKVKGVNGDASMVGKIHYLEIEFENGATMACGFTVINTTTKAIIGLNTMMSHGSTIDLKKRTITFSGMDVKFNQIY